MKKSLTIILCAGAFFASHVFAALSLVVAQNDVSGPYAGANVGYQMSKNNTDMQVVVDDQLQSRVTNLKQDKKNNIAADVYFGYGQTVFSTPIYFGGQIGGSFAQQDKKTYFYDKGGPEIGRYTVRTGPSSMLYADLLPGFVLGRHLLMYGRLGFGGGWYNIKASNDLELRPTVKDKVGAIAYRYGAGMRYVFDSGLGLEANFIHSNYNKMKIYGNRQDQAPHATYSIKPSKNMIDFGVNYTFGQTGEGSQGPALLSD